MPSLTPSAGAGLTGVLLLSWLAIWLGFAVPVTAIPPPAAVLLAWMPILPVVPALFRGRRNAASWCSLAGVFYVGFSVMELVANPASRVWAAVALVLTLLMIAAQIRLIRSARPGS